VPDVEDSARGIVDAHLEPASDRRSADTPRDGRGAIVDGDPYEVIGVIRGGAPRDGEDLLAGEPSRHRASAAVVFVVGLPDLRIALAETSLKAFVLRSALDEPRIKGHQLLRAVNIEL
jgi:hypothetical protein